MGMDVYGNEPRNETGEYFRRNVWGWRPLADYITEMHPEEAKGCAYWHSNDGDGLDAEGSVVLAEALDDAIVDGRVNRWFDERKKQAGSYSEDDISTWYYYNVDSVREFSDFLRNCGGFRIC